MRASVPLVPPTKSPCSRLPGPPRWETPGTRTGQVGTSRPRRRSTVSVAAVRSGRPGPSSASSTGVPSEATYASISAATSGAGGLDTRTMSSTDSSTSSRRRASRVARPPTSAERSRPPTPRAEVTPTPAKSRSESSCWQPVPEAATIPTGPGWTTLAKPRPSPPTTAVPQSGPMTSNPRSAATRLRATSCSTGTLSLNSITSAPASSASIASTAALAPGVETRTSAPGVRAQGGGRGAVRRERAVAGAAGRTAYGGRERAVDGRQAAVEGVVVVHPQGHDHVVGARGGDVEAHAARAPPR